MKDKASFDNCIMNKFLPSAVSFEGAIKYFKRLYGALKYNFRTKEDIKMTYWNVMRAHHPTTNPEDKNEDFISLK
jgi:hypothetical protein